MVFKDTVAGEILGVYGSLDGAVECDGLAAADAFPWTWNRDMPILSP